MSCESRMIHQGRSGLECEDALAPKLDEVHKESQQPQGVGWWHRSLKFAINTSSRTFKRSNIFSRWDLIRVPRSLKHLAEYWSIHNFHVFGDCELSSELMPTNRWSQLVNASYDGNVLTNKNAKKLNPVSKISPSNTYRSVYNNLSVSGFRGTVPRQNAGDIAEE